MNATPTPPTSPSAWPTWVADSVQMGLVVLDLNGHVRLFNRWMAQSSGLAQDQVVGKSLFDIFPELATGRAAIALHACLRHGLPAVLSNSLNPTPFPLYTDEKHRNEGIRRQQSVRIFRSPVQDGGGAQVLIEVADVSSAVARETKLQQLNATLMRSTAATQAALRDNDALLTTLHMHAIISVADQNGSIMEVNDAFCQISGYNREELIGQNHRIVNSGEHPAEFWHSMWSEISTGAPWRGEIRNRAKDGSLYWVDTFITPFIGDDGMVEKYISIRTDITASKNAGQALLLATQAAEEASRSKSQFLANMSHEIRTPMNAILGMLKLLQNTELNARQLDYTTKTEGAAKSLLGLLNDILDFSKMEAGKMELDLQPMLVDRLLRDLSVIFSANVGQKPVEVLFDIDPAVPVALCADAMRLQQVLINLGGNAVKFTSQGQVVLQIKVLKRLGNQSTLAISVRDSGIGIASEHQKHIFDGFSQAESSTTRRFGGTGLGLSISRQLVALMGGELRVESEPGRGSNFYFNLTLADADINISDPAPDATRTVRPMLALVVDDNPVARELMVTMVQSLGWQVDCAASGAQALSMIADRMETAQAPYQTVFIDWQMPGLDGWQTIEQLYQLVLTPHRPLVIMVTAHGRELLSQRSAKEQARLHAFMVKPITAPMLFDVIADVQAGHSNIRSRPRAVKASQWRLKGMRLLVVEDNPINQQVAKELLNAEGAIVELADNGRIGVTAVAQANPQFDAVLMDIQMPVMDGYAATRAIRQELGLLQLPIIAMTANAMASDREACLDAGMNDHVGKPFDLVHLIEVLQQHTRRGSTVVTQTTTTTTRSENVPQSASIDASAMDIDGALLRLGGATELYLRIVQSYLNDLQTAPARLDTLLKAEDWQGAKSLLHTIKGLSATVGATHMSAVASEAENELHTATAAYVHDAMRARFFNAVAQTQTALETVTLQFSQQDGPKNDHAPAPPASLRQLVADLRQLSDRLIKSDMGALDLHARLNPSQDARAHAMWCELERHIAALDFAQAALACEALICALGESH